MPPHDLTSYYPLNVIYPHGGEAYLLVWHTNRDGYALQSLVVANSSKSAQHTWKAILATNPRAVVVSFQCVDLVAPPQWMKEAHARLWDESHQGQFEWWVSGIVRPLQKAKNLPSGLVPCPNCVGNIGYQPWCGDCVHGVLVEGESWSRFYWRHRDAFRMNCRPQPAEMVFGRPSQARELADGERLYAVALDIAHNEISVGLTEPEEDCGTESMDWGLFYTNPRDLDSTHLVQLAETALKVREDADLSQREKNAREQEIKDAADRSLLLSMLSGKVGA